MALRDDIFSSEDLEEEELFIPEWGTAVTIRTMTGREREAFERWMEEAQSSGNFRARVAATFALDREGNRIFTDDDVDRLNARSTAPLIRIFNVWKRLSAVGKKEVEALEEK